MLNLNPTDLYGILRGNNVPDEDARKIVREVIRTSHSHDLHQEMQHLQSKCNQFVTTDVQRFDDWANAAVGPEEPMDSDEPYRGRPVDDNGHPICTIDGDGKKTYHHMSDFLDITQ